MNGSSIWRSRKAAKRLKQKWRSEEAAKRIYARTMKEKPRGGSIAEIFFGEEVAVHRPSLSFPAPKLPRPRPLALSTKVLTEEPRCCRCWSSARTNLLLPGVPRIYNHFGLILRIQIWVTFDVIDCRRAGDHDGNVMHYNGVSGAP
jgi:hypothetical protein